MRTQMQRKRSPTGALVRSFSVGIYAAGALGVSACGNAPAQLPDDMAGNSSAGKPYHYPLDDTLRLQHVQVRGTHNSYHVDTNHGSFDPWAYTHAPIYDQVDRLGIRQLELDVYPEDDGLEVMHVPGVDAGTRCHLIDDCLSEIRRFSDAYPGHMPLYVQIEPKDDIDPADLEPFFAQLEGIIRATFPASRIITPDEVQGAFPTLRDALADHGWPLLGALRGRVFFAFDNSGPLRAAYTHNLTDLHGRLLFVDSSPTDPFAGVSILNDPGDPNDAAATPKAIAANLLVRTRADTDGDEARANDPTRGNAALASGAHYISTDFPEPAPPITYSFTVPGGMPARCNPVNAPKNCTPLAIEDPAFVGSAQSPAP